MQHAGHKPFRHGVRPRGGVCNFWHVQQSTVQAIILHVSLCCPGCRVLANLIGAWARELVEILAPDCLLFLKVLVFRLLITLIPQHAIRTIHSLFAIELRIPRWVPRVSLAARTRVMEAFGVLIRIALSVGVERSPLINVRIRLRLHPVAPVGAPSGTGVSETACVGH